MSIAWLDVSAGVGRTGAFIALDCLLDQADAEGVVDVFAITNQMRKDRINMIQTVVSMCLLCILSLRVIQWSSS